MNSFSLIDITSPEFEKKILEIISKNQPKQSIRFIRLSDGWMKDLTTGLEWDLSSSNYMNLAKAKEYCTSKGGRLPTLKELQSLVDYSKHEPAIDTEAFPDTQSKWYWTSDITAWNKSAAWCVSFGSGLVINCYEDIDGYVRPVRASQ